MTGTPAGAKKAATTRKLNRAKSRGATVVRAATTPTPVQVELDVREIGYLVEGLEAVEQAVTGFSQFDSGALEMTLDNGRRVTAKYDRTDGGWKLLLTQKKEN